RSTADTVVVTDANLQVIARRNLPTGAASAAMTPDGRYLLVAGGVAGALQIIRTADDNVATQVDPGGGVIDVAVSLDGRRAYTVAQGGRLTAVDLNSFQQLSTQNLTGGIAGVSVGPNGLIYVSAINVLYEMDYNTSTNLFRFVGDSGISLNGTPGKPYIIPEGQGGLRAVMVNNTQFPGSAAVIGVDLASRTLNNVVLPGVIMERIIPAAFNRIFAISTAQQLYELVFPGTLNPISFSGLSGAGIRAAAISDEFPAARYLYLASSVSNTVARVDIANNTVTPLPSSISPSAVSFAGPASTQATAKVYTFNNGQGVTPGNTSLPLVMRAVDANDRPVSGAPVQCSITTTTGGEIVSSSATTDGFGYAQVIARAPALLGGFQVTCNIGTGVTVQALFNLNAGTGTVGPSGAISVKSGNGQVIRETAATPELLRVTVKDGNGVAIPGALVRWTVIASGGAPGTLANIETTTDAVGEATNTYIAPFLGPAQTSGFVQATITAATANNSVNMYVTVIPQVFFGNPVPLPTAILQKPLNTQEITAQAGTVVSQAIQVRITAGAGAGGTVGTPIPNVAIAVTTGLDPALGPTVSCKGDTGLSDSNGIASCDLEIGPKLGTATMSVLLAGTGQTLTTFTLIVTPGVPGKITIVQGDGQVGNAGQQLPQALVAEVQDTFGNRLPGARVTWAVEAGTATIVNPITTADLSARVSALVRLGAVSGPVRVRVTGVNGVAAATALFNLTITGGGATLQRLSGDGQNAVAGQSFGAPLVARVVDLNGAAVAGAQVTFSLAQGQASLNPQSAVSDANGQVSTSVVAGGTPGQVVITALFGESRVTWTLNVTAQGPQIAPNGVQNAAGGTGIAPGSIATIRATNLVPNVNGYVLPSNPLGPLPTTLSGVSVLFGGVPAPIFWVANVSGQQAVTVQVPFEAAEGTIPVTVNASGATTTVNVLIQAVAPGIFESTDAQGRRFGVVTRSDGTFVTPDNPIARGERAHVLVTGLGRTQIAAFTNAPGTIEQKVIAPVTVGVNNQGVPVLSAEYAQNLIGVYVVTFQIPADSGTGTALNLAVAADPGSGNVFGNGSTIAVR
ncbi:MAG: hypothetical protein SFV51_24835, partial [Bryobacteraceae bacterium]|nr:hypothetical protein [Bryobacteraceae bacterium]